MMAYAALILACLLFVVLVVRSLRDELPMQRRFDGLKAREREIFKRRAL